MTLSDCVILIIDDVSSVSEYLQLILQQLGVKHIQAANNGKQAIGHIQKQRYDMIFLDIELPDINGQTLLKQLKTAAPDTHIIMLTAHNTVENVKQSIDAGASGFIAKPFTAVKVKNIVERCMAAKFS